MSAAVPPPDEVLVAAVLRGDRAAYRTLVDRHAPAVFAVVRSFVRDAHLGDDLAQEAFVRAWRRMRQFDASRGSFRGWLLAIVRNRCRDALRSAAAKRPLGEATGLDVALHEAAPDEQGQAVALGCDPGVVDALALLSPAHRVAFLLVHVFEVPVAEVATIERVAVGTIKSRAHRARALLRAHFAPRTVSHE